MFPITTFVVEDVAAHTKGGKRWNQSFAPLQVGKRWFYEVLGKLARVEIKSGLETKLMRDALGLKKIGKKTAEVFEAHCVDSWVLANWWTGDHTNPDNTRLLCITPLRFHRGQLHRFQPDAGGVRKPYGGTRSWGFKRGSIVKPPRYGVTYVGGWLKDRLSL